MSDKTAYQAEMLANRLKKRLAHLSKWAKRMGTNAFRLYDRDIPEIPLVLDKYGDVVSGALYQRPYEKDPAEEAQWLAAMCAAAAYAVGVDKNNIIIKQRMRQRGEESQYEKVGSQGLTRTISENGLLFRVNLSDYLDTGLFLDRRAMRRMVDSGGKRVLNLFCYTGSFSVHAAAGGAMTTDSVDLSNTYLNWARENFSLNGIETEMLRLEEFIGGKHHTAHRLIRADVSAFLEKAAAARLQWDTIILDPPAFSNSTMARADFDLQRDYEALLANCLSLLPEGNLDPDGSRRQVVNNGTLWFSAAARSFKASAAELETLLVKRFPNVTVVDISNKTVDEDFKGKKVPKSFILTL